MRSNVPIKGEIQKKRRILEATHSHREDTCHGRYYKDEKEKGREGYVRTNFSLFKTANREA